MGMSHDFEIAIEEGATEIRVGTALFGERHAQESPSHDSKSPSATETIVFAVRVTPRASRDAIEGEYQGALKVRLTAPPVDDRANDALRRLLAARLNVPALGC